LEKSGEVERLCSCRAEWKAEKERKAQEAQEGEEEDIVPEVLQEEGATTRAAEVANAADGGEGDGEAEQEGEELVEGAEIGSSFLSSPTHLHLSLI
jgi:hypothetical protein